MDSTRRTAVIAGVCYLITHVTSVGAVILYGSVVTRSDLAAVSGVHGRLLLGVLLEVILAMANIGTAVALFPVARRYNEGLALGYVGLRTLEAAVIAVGVVPLMALTTLPAGAVAVGTTLVALHNGTFLVGPGFVVGVNTVLMAYLMYRSRLVPRIIPVLGLIGGPVVFVSSAAQLFGLYSQFASWLPATAVPAFAWEISFALYLIIKGFRTGGAESRPAQVGTGRDPLATQPR